MAATRGVDVRGFSTVQHFPESIHRCLDAQHGSWPTDLVKGMSMSPSPLLLNGPLSLAFASIRGHGGSQRAAA